MCSDEFILLDGTGNQKFCEELLNWNFKLSGLLRATNLRHNKKGEACKNLEECGPNPENYKIEDQVEFYVNIEQMTAGKWQPYNADDIQMQFKMLDPYYQVMLERVEKPGTPEYAERSTYTYAFRTPQRLGIFKFVIDYWRYGFTFMEEESQVAVIQWRHDGFPRYLTRAFPFYASVFVMMAAFFVFTVSFLFSEFKRTRQTKKE